MGQLQLMKEAEDQKRAIELKMRKQQDKKMKDVEKEILRIKQSKKRQKRESGVMAKTQLKRMEELQRQLMVMKVEQQKQENDAMKDKEFAEIKELQHNSKVRALKEQMGRVIRDQDTSSTRKQTLEMKTEKDEIKHKIQIMKM